jgi:hypothetical protein
MSDLAKQEAYHGVKKELCRCKTRVETVFNESFRCRNLRVSFKVGQGSILKTVGNAFTVQGLLTHTSNHLRDVDERTFRSKIKLKR